MVSFWYLVGSIAYSTADYFPSQVSPNFDAQQRRSYTSREKATRLDVMSFSRWFWG